MEALLAKGPVLFPIHGPGTVLSQSLVNLVERGHAFYFLPACLGCLSLYSWSSRDIGDYTGLLGEGSFWELPMLIHSKRSNQISSYTTSGVNLALIVTEGLVISP